MAEITLRPISPSDEEFLCGLYASTREEELEAVPWDAAQKAAFLQMQFAAQSHHYHTHYPDSDFQIILADGAAVGRLYLHRGPTEFRIVDIALLPEWRGQGIGSALMASVLAEADALGRSVTLYVEGYNRASRLYERLGFVQGSLEGVYYFMERPPCPTAAS